MPKKTRLTFDLGESRFTVKKVRLFGQWAVHVASLSRPKTFDSFFLDDNNSWDTDEQAIRALVASLDKNDLVLMLRLLEKEGK